MLATTKRAQSGRPEARSLRSKAFVRHPYLRSTSPHSAGHAANVGKALNGDPSI